MTKVLTKERQLMNVQDVADQLAVSKGVVYRLIGENKIQSLRVGRHLRVTTESLKSFVEQGGAR